MKTFINNTNKRRFELVVDGYTAYVDYVVINPKLVNLSHTIVPEPLRNKGIGSELAEKSLQEIEKMQCKVLPSCSFIAGYIRKHSDLSYLVADNYYFD